MANLQNIFNIVRRYSEVDYGRQPPLEYETLAQVSGVAASYAFPCSLSAKAYDQGALRLFPHKESYEMAVRKHLQDTWSKLVSLNPSLEIVEPVSPKTLRHAIFGVASLFNPQDIRFFIEAEKETDGAPTGFLMQQIPAYRKLTQAIGCRTGVNTEWVPAPETLLLIYEQVKNRIAKYNMPAPYAEFELAGNILVTPDNIAAGHRLTTALSHLSP